MFLIRLPPSMREAAGTGNHKTAAAMVTAADALWDACGSHNPTFAATMTQRNRSPAPKRKNDKRGGNARSKSQPPSSPDFFHFFNPPNSKCKPNLPPNLLCLAFFRAQLDHLHCRGPTPPPPTPLAKESQADLFQCSSQGNQSIVDTPLSVQPIPDSVPTDVKLLLKKFPAILRTGDVVPNPSHEVEHHNQMGGHPPVFAKARRLDTEKLEIAKEEFKRLESTSILRRSTSPWVSPLHMIPKKDGSWWPCGE
jgi:hypothetical protein